MKRATISLPAEMRSARHRDPAQVLHLFKPNGRPALRNGKNLLKPNWRSKDPMLAARLFVGFNVGNEAVYEMKDLVKLVQKVREDQGTEPDATFVYQHGLYTHQDGSGNVVSEEGAQVIILKLDPGQTKEDFEQQMLQLANVIVAEMQQETVIVEFQRAGSVQEVVGVTTTETELDTDD